MHHSTVGDTRFDVAIPMLFATFVLSLDQQSQAQTRQHGTCMFGDTFVAIGCNILQVWCASVALIFGFTSPAGANATF